MVIQYMPGGVKEMLLRIQPENMEAALKEIEDYWEEIFPEKIFRLTYLVDALADLYKQESRFARILTIFSGLNLFISLLGIFGMARLNTERRTREVGIRKVMGAESSHVLNRFVFEYILLTLIAALIAFPSAYLLMTKWLSNFQYHGNLSIAVFAGAWALSMVVVGATVSWQVWKAANSNPIDAIRYE
jgi:putative ABC transport system permease protein